MEVEKKTPFIRENWSTNTLPETNIANENGWLEYLFPFGAKRPIFRGDVMLVSGMDSTSMFMNPKECLASHEPSQIVNLDQAAALRKPIHLCAADDPSFLRSRLCVPKITPSIVNISPAIQTVISKIHGLSKYHQYDILSDWWYMNLFYGSRLYLAYGISTCPIKSILK